MHQPRKGIRIPISPARAMVCELLHHAAHVPSLPLSRETKVADLVAARNRAAGPPSWIAVFMKAYGLVSRRHPVLRRALIRWPWPHFYEHPESESAILIEREWRGEAVVLGAKLRSPENMSLAEIDGHLRRFRHAPVESIGYFRQILRLGRLPWPLRRFTFWQSLHLSGFKRAKRFGTFMISSLGNFGVEQQHPMTPLTTYFTFGPIRDGRVNLKIVYDHRVLDGRSVARALVDLESILNEELLMELRDGFEASAERLKPPATDRMPFGLGSSTPDSQN